MHVTLETRYVDGTVQHSRTYDAPDERTALSWALENWHPARGGRIPGSASFYLNDWLLVSVDGGAFRPVSHVLARIKDEDAEREYGTPCQARPSESYIPGRVA